MELCIFVWAEAIYGEIDGTLELASDAALPWPLPCSYLLETVPLFYLTH